MNVRRIGKTERALVQLLVDDGFPVSEGNAPIEVSVRSTEAWFVLQESEHASPLGILGYAGARHAKDRGYLICCRSTRTGGQAKLLAAREAWLRGRGCKVVRSYTYDNPRSEANLVAAGYSVVSAEEGIKWWEKWL